MLNTTKTLNLKDTQGFIAMNAKTEGYFFMYSEQAQDYTYIRPPSISYNSYIHACREVLAEKEIQPGEYVGFHVRGFNTRIDLFIKFWDEIENLLKLPEKSEIYLTNNKDAIIFKINSFWGSSRTRRQFFSLFLRAGAVFHKEGNTIEQTLEAYNLAKLILPACKYFLAGNTVNPKDNEINWNYKGIVETFKNYYSLDEVKASGRLVKE